MSLFSSRRQSPRPAAWSGEATQDPESNILAALDNEDPDRALTLLMNVYGQALYRFCVQMLREEELARDVHQMTFVQAYESFANFRRQSSAKSWLFSIARHRCLDALKIQRRRLARIEPVADLPESSAAEPDVEDDLASRSLTRALSHCLDDLTPQVRMAVLLRYREEVSYPEMANICGERAATLQARVARALPVLRRCLEGRGMSL